MPMPVHISTTELDGVLLVQTDMFRDDRGFFTETYNREMWEQEGFRHLFVQDNLSLSAKGTLRGMHYQKDPHGMGKLVRVLAGSVFDVAVDLRRGSPSHGKWVGKELTAQNGLSLWVPVGFAHGFVALEDDTLVSYKCTSCHHPESERSLSFRCPSVGIEWPLQPTIVSAKDADAPPIEEADYNFGFKDRGAR